MISTLSLIAAALGIKLSARIIGFISEELTTEEIEKQKQLKQSYNVHLEKQKKADQIADSIIETKMQQLEEMTEIEINELRKNEEKQIRKEIKKDIIDLLSAKAAERRQYIEKQFIPELKASIERIKEIRKHTQNTAMRSNALKMLENELRDILERAKAYVKYLDKYIKQIERIYDNNIELNDEQQDMLFSYTLPEKWTYNGKLLYINRDELTQNKGYGKFILHNTIELDYYIEDAEIYSKNTRVILPLFQKSFDRKTYKNVYSFTIGEYMDICRSGAYSGIPAVIERYDDRSTLIAKYNDSMELVLKAKNLINFNHFPPPGSDIIVYPLFENYKNNNWTFYVSQRPENVQISLWFDTITLNLPVDKAQSFLDYWKSNNLSDSCMDTKIAPYNQGFHKVIESVKIQFVEEYIILANVIYQKESNKSYLEFNQFLDMNEKITPDDIFVPFNAEISIVLSNEIDSFDNEKIQDNINNLVITLFKEFRRQYFLKNNAGGSRYFDTWEMITYKLKEFLEIGDSICCNTIGVPDKIKTEFGIILKYVVENRDELISFYKKHNYINNKHIGFIEFFTVFAGLRLSVNISYMKQFDFEVMIPQNFEKRIDIDELMLMSTITIYKKDDAIPEQRQLGALHQYKIGALANPELQAFIINGNNIYSDRNKIDEIDLFNQKLKSDQSQYNALISCLEENDFFMIQGPPGTGKTTVIRELMHQTLLQNSDARILIVSQANVAVDNVIKGVSNMGITSDNVIRCGRAEKIQPEIEEYSYEKKYSKYFSQLIKRTQGDDRISVLSNRWLSVINAKNYEPEIGELLISSHSIIGATCIGLGQKKIGIDKIDFDLIIIDEAAKALAPELLLPILNAKKVIMIGDHKQLPAVINPILYDEEKIEIDDRKYCKNVLFQQSLFERLYNVCPPSNKATLTTQYRMPSVIGDMINQVFYNRTLKNGNKCIEKKPIFFDSNISIIDMSFEHSYVENDINGSPTNEFEANYVIALIKKIRLKNPDCKIAIITPYKGQKRLIKNKYINDKKCKRDNMIFIDTIDSFQGDESEIVIFCTTRSKKQTAFFRDKRRLNVALSRPKNELIIICSKTYLKSYNKTTPVRKVIDYIEKHGIVQPIIPLDFGKTTDTILIVDIKSIELSDYSIYDENAIEKAKDYYLKNGHFSSYPSVYRNDVRFIMYNHYEIFYAALECKLKEIEVVLDNKQ